MTSDRRLDDPEEGREALARLREDTRRWRLRELGRGRCATGRAALDALLGGGWPQGKASELVGPGSSGGTAVAAATLAAAGARGELTAWLDPADAFDPASATAAGVDLERVLWVRPRGLEETVRAAELVLELCGFPVVVVDVTGLPGGRRAAPLRLRLARAVERAGATALVLSARPWLGTLAGVTLALGRGGARWAGDEGQRWMEGIVLRARVERGEAGRGADARPAAWRRRAAGE
ncbi:MAG: hypothetical protein AB1625_12605 [Acidobacteriota bacterium]